MGFVFEKILCGVLSPNSAETPLQNYIESATQLYTHMYSVLYHILLTTFKKKKRVEMYPQLSYTPNILSDVHVINFTKKRTSSKFTWFKKY